jgi:hypothetical protein
MASSNHTARSPDGLFSAMHGGGKDCLRDIHKAAYAIEAASRLIESWDEGEEWMTRYDVGGLQAGILVLSRGIQEETTLLLSWLGADAWGDKASDDEQEGGSDD